MDACSVSTILSRSVYDLSFDFCIFCPFPCYRIYDVKDAKFVRSRGFLEMSVQFLNEDRFRLVEVRSVVIVNFLQNVR